MNVKQLKFKIMKNSRLLVKGDFDTNNKVNFEIIETVFTGKGTLDYVNTTIAKGKTDKSFTDAELDEYDENYTSLNTVVAKYFITEFNLNEDFDIQISID